MKKTGAGSSEDRRFEITETTRSIVEQILSGAKLTSDDIIDQGMAESRLDGLHHLGRALINLRKYHPHIPVGYVRGNGRALGTYQKLDTLEEKIDYTRRSLCISRGYIRGSSRVMTNATTGLSMGNKAAVAEAVRGDFTENMAAFGTLTLGMLVTHDPEAAKRLAKTFQKQLEAGK